MDDPKKFGDWLDTIGSAWGWVVAVVGAAMVAFRWVFSVVRSVRLSGLFHSHFGRDPAKALHKAIEKTESLCGRFEIVQALITEHLGLALYVCDEHGQCIWVNKQLCELWGCDATDLLGQGWLRGIDDSDRADVWEDWMRCVKTGVPYSDVEYTITNKRTGLSLKVLTTAYAVKVDNAVKCFVGCVTRLDQK